MTATVDGAEPGSRRLATIRNRRGLHARAAARFVKLAWEYDAEVTVAKNGTQVSGRSIMGLMMLAAGPGTEIELRATGPQAQPALDALAALIESGFDEE
ncbi:MAG TPA: HPr family phosphocarrier protein [Stellaceae bacterium]|jgi:phosphocarrier protein|nr:HPr family phosphocarrier protein [Stellaceae bacterium]